MTVLDTKSRDNRKVPLTLRAVAMLKARGRGTPKAFVFGRKDGGARLQVTKTFVSVADSIGLNDDIEDRRQKVVFHSLRHTYASNLIKSGASQFQVKELLGHRTLAMTDRYTHFDADQHREAVARMEAQAAATGGAPAPRGKATATAKGSKVVDLAARRARRKKA